MKTHIRTIVLLFFFLAFGFIASPTFAADHDESTSSDSSSELTTIDNSSYVGGDEAPYLFPAPTIGLSNAPQAIYISTEWKIWTHPYFSNIPLTKDTLHLKSSKFRFLSKEYEVETKLFCKMGKEFKDQPIRLHKSLPIETDYTEKGLRILGYTEVRGLIGDGILEAAVLKALEEGKKKTNAIGAIVEYDSRLQTEVDLNSIGLSGAGSRAVGGAGEMANAVVGGTGAVGFGRNFTVVGKINLVKITWTNWSGRTSP